MLTRATLIPMGFGFLVGVAIHNHRTRGCVEKHLRVNATHQYWNGEPVASGNIIRPYLPVDCTPGGVIVA